MGEAFYNLPFLRVFDGGARGDKDKFLRIRNQSFIGFHLHLPTEVLASPALAEIVSHRKWYDSVLWQRLFIVSRATGLGQLVTRCMVLFCILVEDYIE